jgi:two-component system chemotaxis sensor kinase CheA
VTNDADFLAGFMDDYFAECDEHLAAIRRLLLVLDEGLDRGETDPAVLDDLFRTFHSIKGISGMVELREAEMLAHHMEGYLRVLRQGEATLTKNGLDALISGVDALERTIAPRRSGDPAPASHHVVESLSAVTPAPGSTTPARAVASASKAAANWKVTFIPSSSLVSRGVNVDSVRARLRAAGTIVDAAPRVQPDGVAFEFLVAGDLPEALREQWREDGISAEQVNRPPDTPAPEPQHRAADETSAHAIQPSHVVRVDLTRLDELMRMIGDLVITRARMDATLRNVERHVPPVEWRPIQENSVTLERQLRDLREGVVRLRLVPVSEIFRRVPFVVRDLAREFGKDVRVELRGQDTEIDKFLIERMLDPIVHLVRNAVSHGFETPAEREAAGKPRHGTLTVAAAGVGDMVVLEVSDDGRGIDAAQVLARARDAGIVAADGAVDDSTLLRIICAPGFSTRNESDRASGRGVGMAVVQTTIDELNGTLSLDTTPGRGTRFTIELPLTLSITDALLAAVGDRRFAVPQASVREVVEVAPDVLRRVGRHEVAPFRGGMLPIVRLSEVFGIEARPGRALHVFVVGTGLDAVGLAVDRITGQREIVVRSMTDALVDVPGVLGATDLGDGRVVLIIDAAALARRAPAGFAGTQP